MKTIPFTKMHGAGNDFILIDSRSVDYKLSLNEISALCSRRLGVGADGLMLLEKSPQKEHAFYMRYYNADGSSGAMCGNGGRCIARFAHELLSLRERFTFLADDGPHEAFIHSKEDISLNMADMEALVSKDSFLYGKSGTTPHLVVLMDEPIANIDLDSYAPNLRHSYNANVNIAFSEGDFISARTFERGVEGETLACGTGACVIAAAFTQNPGDYQQKISMPGGMLEISFTKTELGTFEKVWMRGPVKKVFTAYVNSQSLL